ncbi:4'-phosphopantetheinyl transferase superfamily protein [Flavobacterium agricola]|uniref:4'-phosphopantetheinyl transferase superfamily protein n=1 Tax=Flavobacterium agricola TaxID=2870839 RepID=A0ABY6M1S0_9FLAO|nr:4'-phosphopantetheinyl transferase family protein [Flavobacterium agricola]UYW00818.1 4'-phosphopantetheinyl transferase superfamily protein [Flavobacterium agricola]
MAFLKKLTFTENTDIYIWKITEDFDFLIKNVILKPESLNRVNSMKSESHRKGFLAVRMLLQHCGYTDHDLWYDETGKPNLIDGKKISITHSFDYSVIAISNQDIGVDIELCREKVIRISNKFAKELFVTTLLPNEKTRTLTFIWGAKESIFKIMNEPGISFLDHIMVQEINLNKNKTNAVLEFNNQTVLFDIFYTELDNYCLVYAEKNEKQLTL